MFLPRLQGGGIFCCHCTEVDGKIFAGLVVCRQPIAANEAIALINPDTGEQIVLKSEQPLIDVHTDAIFLCQPQTPQLTCL